MDNVLYHVLLEGRRVGPYDRRTIVGMRMKKALASAQVLEAPDGAQLTVAELVYRMEPAEPVDAVPMEAAPVEARSVDGGRSGSHSVVQGVFTATLREVEGGGYQIPAFKGELEVRAQTRVLRIAGRVREGLGWKEDRVKFPLQDIAHARLAGKVVDLWIRSADQPALQRISLEMASPDAAGELTEALTHAAPWPGSEPLARVAPGGAAAVPPMLWLGLVSGCLGVLAMLAWALARRF